MAASDIAAQQNSPFLGYCGSGWSARRVKKLKRSRRRSVIDGSIAVPEAVRYSFGAINDAIAGGRGKGAVMDWARILACVIGTVDQELLARNEYPATESGILKDQPKGRLMLSDAERATLVEIGHELALNDTWLRR